MLIFAAKKRRKELDMFILGTIGIVAVAIGGLLLISNEESAPKSRKPRKTHRYADPPGWGTPHGF